MTLQTSQLERNIRRKISQRWAPRGATALDTKVKFFAKTVNGIQPLIIFSKAHS